MKSLLFLKTIDLVVWPENFDSAVAAWERLLGDKAIPMRPEYNPDGKAKAAHIPLPRGEYACHSIGIFTPTDEEAEDNDRLRRHLEQHGEGVWLLAFMMNDIKKAQQEALDAGFELAYDSERDYAVGVHNFVVGGSELQDLRFQLAVHHEGGLDEWLSLANKS